MGDQQFFIGTSTLKARNFVVRVRDDARSNGKHAHIESVHMIGMIGFIDLPTLSRLVHDPLTNECLCLRMQSQLQAQCSPCTMTRVVIWRCPNATTGEDNVSAVKGSSESLCDAIGIVSHIVSVVQLKATFSQQFNDFTHVFVCSFARHDFIAHNDKAKGRRGRGVILHEREFNKCTRAVHERLHH